jgi:hypothetical protein
MPRALLAALVACVLTAAAPSSVSDAERYVDQFIDRSINPRDDSVRVEIW